MFRINYKKLKESSSPLHLSICPCCWWKECLAVETFQLKRCEDHWATALVICVTFYCKQKGLDHFEKKAGSTTRNDESSLFTEAGFTPL